MPPTIAPATVATRDDFDDVFDGLVEVFGGEVVVVLKCMFCIGILCTLWSALGKAICLKRTSEPMEQTLHLVQD